MIGAAAEGFVESAAEVASTDDRFGQAIGGDFFFLEIGGGKLADGGQEEESAAKGSDEEYFEGIVTAEMIRLVDQGGFELFLRQLAQEVAADVDAAFEYSGAEKRAAGDDDDASLQGAAQAQDAQDVGKRISA